MARGTGARAVQRNLRRRTEAALAAVAQGLYLEGNHLVGDAKRNTPVDKGVLRNSGYVTLPERSGNGIVVEIGFGGFAEEYAEAVHEDMGAHHEVGGAKFLERAVDAREGRIVSSVARLAKAALASGTAPKVSKTGPTSPWDGGDNP